MNYPEEARLIAMGKYSMHSRERHAQIERMQGIAKKIMHLANPLLQDCQEKPPADGSILIQLQDCLKNAENARTKIIEQCKAMDELKPVAWPE